MVLTGPDCSRHQGVVDWRRVKAAGHAFGICKLTDGTVYRYVDWGRRNLPLVRQAGLIPGAYHWLYGPKDAAAQARVYVDEVNRLGGFQGLLAVVDVERDDDGSVPSYANVQSFAAEFKRLVPGHPLIIYTGRWFWRDILGDFPGAVIGPLWHSEYEPSLAEVEDGPELDSYGGWSHATLWQFTSSATVPGVSGNCDLNRFFGTIDDLLALAGAKEDDMTPDECRIVVRDELRRTLAFLTTGAGNQLTGGQDWVADAVTLPKVAAAVKGIDADVDVPALAQQLAAALPALQVGALVETLLDQLPPEVARVIGQKLVAS